MSVLADYQYTLEDFLNIKENSNINELDMLTIKIINKIASKVGAPNYIKTPVFKKNRTGYKKKNDWGNTQNFKKTVLHKNETGIEVEFDKIRSYLNKLTKKNYSEQFDNILCIFKNIESNNKEYLLKVGKSIFEIGSRNKFWCDLYAKLYYDLIKEYPYMKDICVSNFNSFSNIFNEINYVNSQEDYNLFCEYNKENEKRKALSKFFVLCSNYDIIEKKNIIDIVFNFIDKVNLLISEENKLNHVDEIVQNLKIIISNFGESYKTLDSYKIIQSKMESMTSLNVKNYFSLNNKILFNILDISDIM